MHTSSQVQSSLESDSEEIAFALKHSGTKEVLASEIFQLEKNKFYNVIACGSKEIPPFYPGN